VALTAGAVFLVFALSGVLDNSGLLRHDWWWSIGVIVVAAAMLVVATTIQRLVDRPDRAEEPAPPTDPGSAAPPATG
jgi:putative effector of murein hydrolase LrgA (UPF0299 family)